MKTSEFQFVNPYLVELNYSIYNKFDVKQNMEIENEFDIKINKAENENFANVQLELKLNENSNVPFKMSIIVASDFVWDNLEQEAIDELLRVNAPSLLLGYMRPIVANITGASNLPTYHIPFINFNQ